MLYNEDVQALRQRLYQGYKSFKKFDNLTDEDIERIRNEVSFFNEASPVDRYVSILRKYTASTGHLHRSFDEKIAGVIEGCDPNLISLKTYVLLGKPDKTDTEAMKIYEQMVRNKIGIFDPNLRQFEAAYNNHVLNRKHEDVKKLVRTKKESK